MERPAATESLMPPLLAAWLRRCEARALRRARLSLLAGALASCLTDAHRRLAPCADPVWECGGWLAVAGSLGCAVAPFRDPDGGRGEYAPVFDSCLSPGGRGVVRLNVSHAPHSQARCLVHELSHHLLDTRLHLLLPGDWHAPFGLSDRDGHPEALGECVCCLVERRVFGERRPRWFEGLTSSDLSSS